MAAVLKTFPARTDSASYQAKLQVYLASLSQTKLPPRHDDAGVGHSGPQGKVVPFTIVDDPSAWTAADLHGCEAEYTFQLETTHKKEIIAAAAVLQQRGVSTEASILQLKKEDYQYPVLAPVLRDLARQVSEGRGFQIIRGFPVEAYENNQLGLVLAYWGLALHAGRVLVSQTDLTTDGTIYGSKLAHITSGRFAKGTDAERSVKQNDLQRLAFHSDQGATDIISLLCLATAENGGESKLVSSIAIHNELLRRGRKDLVEVLAQPWKVAKKLDQHSFLRGINGELDFEVTVPFEYHDGYLSVQFYHNNYLEALEVLTPLQQEAIWLVAKLAEDEGMHLSFNLQPGDIECALAKISLNKLAARVAKICAFIAVDPKYVGAQVV